MQYGLVLLWWAFFILLAIAGLPIAATLLSRLPDRGAGLALPLSLTVLFVPVYWIGHVRFGPLIVGLAVLLLLAGATVSYLRVDPEIDRSRFLQWAGVFTAAFLFLVAIRAVDPAVHPIGGEKFLDFGLLKSILRDTTVPPEDMWFAGEPVRYYYGGHLLSAVLTMLTGTAPKYAYNLALAGFYATLVASAFGLAGSIAASRGSPYLRGGLLGAFFVGVASNLVTPLQMALTVLPDGLAGTVAGWFATVPEDGRGLGLKPSELTNGFSGYWTPSRVIQGTINEFPLFSWLNGDLHAHMMSQPFLLLVAAIGLAYYLTPAERLRNRRVLLFGVIPPVGGMIAIVNTWSFPSVAGITFLAALFAPSDPRDLLPGAIQSDRHETGWRDELARIGGAFGTAVGVFAIAAIWALPFLLGPATGASGRSIGLLADRSDLVGVVLVHGWVLLVFGVYLLGRVDAEFRPAETAAMVGMLLVLALFADAAAFAVVGSLLLIAWIGLRDRAALGYESVLFVAGAGLVLLVEVVFLVDPGSPGRMNTVFKSYTQVWILWGVATGGALSVLLPDRSIVAPDGERVFSVVAVVLVVSLSLYGVLAVGSHFQNAPDATLDATAFVEDRHPREAGAIDWIDDLEGQPTIVTAAPGGYSWRPSQGKGASAPSSLTGVPTVLGWFHERQYRGQGPYGNRLAHVRAIYSASPGERVRLLETYDVAYVYVGPAEQAKYDSPESVGDLGGVSAVPASSEWSSVTIYRVDQSALAVNASG